MGAILSQAARLHFLTLLDHTCSSLFCTILILTFTGDLEEQKIALVFSFQKSLGRS